MSDLTDWWPLPATPGGEAGTAVRDELLAAYSSGTRHYHDARHLTEVCLRIDELWSADPCFDRDTVLLAAWFHDAVYAGERDDEERSALWAQEALSGLGLPGARVAEVVRLVRMTTTHHPCDDDPAGCALSDADLAILAAPPDRYAEYAAAIRREYAAVPDQDFRAGRAAVLRDLLAKPHLFHTAHARRAWEESARVNVAQELARLEA